VSDRRGLAVEERWLTIAGLRHFHRLAGEERAGTLPLVLLHGLGVSSAYWARVLPLLAARRRVYAPDLPGFGQTDDPPYVPDSAAMARAMIAWLDRLGLGRVHLLAHSQGAQIASELADKWPERVASLVLAGVTLGKHDPTLPRLALRLLRDLPREWPSLLPVVGRGYLRAGPWRMVATNHVFNHEDSVAIVARLRVPILLVRGARDPVMTARSLHALHQAAPHARTLTIPGAAHALHWSHPRTLASYVNSFLADVER